MTVVGFFMRQIFLTFLGIALVGIGSIFAVKSTSDHRWIGIVAAMFGALVFLFGFTAIVGFLWRNEF